MLTEVSQLSGVQVQTGTQAPRLLAHSPFPSLPLVSPLVPRTQPATHWAPAPPKYVNPVSHFCVNSGHGQLKGTEERALAFR